MKKLLFGILIVLTGNATAQEFVYDSFNMKEINREVELVIYDRKSFGCGKTAFDFRLKKSDAKFKGKFSVSTENAEIIDGPGRLWLKAHYPGKVQLTVTFINKKEERSVVKEYDLGRLCIEENAPEPPARILVPPPPAPAPDEPIRQTPVVDFPDKQPGFPGGSKAMRAFIDSAMVYPQTSIAMNEQGKVYLSFVVETDGSLSSIKIERGVSRDLDREAKRILRTMPKWTPGEAAGKVVRTRCRLPIIFTLEENIEKQ